MGVVRAANVDGETFRSVTRGARQTLTEVGIGNSVPALTSLSYQKGFTVLQSYSKKTVDVAFGGLMPQRPGKWRIK
jgi:hypothetical protein